MYKQATVTNFWLGLIHLWFNNVTDPPEYKSEKIL